MKEPKKMRLWELLELAYCAQWPGQSETPTGKGWLDVTQCVLNWFKERLPEKMDSWEWTDKTGGMGWNRCISEIARILKEEDKPFDAAQLRHPKHLEILQEEMPSEEDQEKKS